MDQTERIPALRTIAMPADTNPRGDIFGGWLLSQMDLAGSVLAQKTATQRVATVGVQAMTFHQPVFVGDEVSCYTELVRVGNTSVTVQVESWARRCDEETEIKVTEGQFTYVAIDENRRPVQIPKDST
ncbi:MAG: acyl-CoA thioesterase [Pseudomonadota bacterium]|nr:acyl-CoA thioesterase [Pseudomonadota bacterium]QKK04752.1 MAG: acyl-CoA thioesterase [Pseudomonadota bacterium]